MSTFNKIAGRLAKSSDVRRIYARSRIAVGDLVADAGLSMVPSADVGTVMEIRVGRVLVAWRNGDQTVEHATALQKVANGFEHPLPNPDVWTPRPEALVKFSTKLGELGITCGVARTSVDKTSGLQRYSHLPPKVGLLFPYDRPSTQFFHMAAVKFPIDMIFIQPDPEGRFGRVSKIVDLIYPGTPGSWGDSNVLAVVEVAGGYSRAAGLDPGDVVEFADLRTADISDPEAPLENADAPHTDMFRDTDNVGISAPAPGGGGAGSIGMPKGTDSTSITVGDDRPFGDPDEGSAHRMGSKKGNS